MKVLTQEQYDSLVQQMRDMIIKVLGDNPDVRDYVANCTDDALSQSLKYLSERIKEDKAARAGA